VVYFDGLDVTKEIQYVRGVPDLIKRGISVLVMDGPGTGEAIRFRGQYLRHDYEVAGSACVDWLEKRDDVDAKKIGVVAISLGGYYAPRMASMEPRFAACIAWGRDLGLPRDLEKTHRGEIQDLAVGTGPPHHLDPRRRYAGRSAEKTRTVQTRRRGAKDEMPVPHCSWRRRRAGAAGRRTRRSTTPQARRTRRCACSPPKKAARSIASATT